MLLINPFLQRLEKGLLIYAPITIFKTLLSNDDAHEQPQQKH